MNQFKGNYFFRFQTNEAITMLQKLLGDGAITLPFSLTSLNKITSNKRNSSNRVVSLGISKGNWPKLTVLTLYTLSKKWQK